MMAINSSPKMSRSSSSPSPQDSLHLHESAEQDFEATFITLSKRLKQIERADNLGAVGDAARNARKTLENQKEKGTLSYRDVSSLEEVLRNADQCNLLHFLESYVEKYTLVAHSDSQLSKGLQPCNSSTSLQIPQLNADKISPSLTSTCLSCPCGLGEMITSVTVSQESGQEGEVESKSSLVAPGYECTVAAAKNSQFFTKNLPQTSEVSAQESKCSNNPSPPSFMPSFRTKTASCMSGPQISTIQCSEAEQYKPSMNLISTLHGIATGENKGTEEPPSSSNSSQGPNFHGDDSKSPSPPLLHYDYQPHLMTTVCPQLFTRQISDYSNITLTGNISPQSNNSSNSELDITPQSSPSPSSARVGYLSSKPISCTENSLCEHKPLTHAWQTQSISSRLSQITSSTSTETVVHSPPILRENLCRKICRLDQDQESDCNLIPFTDHLTFSNESTLNLWLKPRGTEDHCGLVVRITTLREQWCHPESRIDVELCVSVSEISAAQMDTRTSTCNDVQGKRFSIGIDRSSCTTPQEVTLPAVVLHRTITHHMTASSLQIMVTAKMYESHETADGYVDIDLNH